MQHSTRPPLVLVAPLNWGLGHATRCISLVQALQKLGCEVIIASDGASRTLLVEEFPLLTHLSSPHTPIRYSRHQWLFGWAMLKLIPRFWLQIKREQQWIKKIVARYAIDAIIADNRYGLAHPGTLNVIVTHQLAIRTGYGHLADRVTQRLLYRYINRYQQVWVPDVATEPSLAGALSHPRLLPGIPVQYIGFLNRLSTATHATVPLSKELPQRLRVLVLLSGPEPQRTLLEKIILDQVASFNGALTLVRGLPSSSADTSAMAQHHAGALSTQQMALLYGTPHVKIFDHKNAADLRTLLAESDYIICRSGYTTLMEMIPLQKRLLLVPTPGQPEQTYLAAYANSHHYAPFFVQKRFSITKALTLAQQYPYQLSARFTAQSPLPGVLAHWIEQHNSVKAGSR